MDRPATAQKSRLNAGPGNIEIIETSRTFPRPGIVTGIDSLRRHLPYVLWTGCHRVPLRNATRVPGDNYDERRIASSRNVPERSGHCLTRMLPWPRHFGNRRPIGSSDWHPKDAAAWGDLLVRAAIAQDPLSCSIGEPAFPSRPGAARAAARNRGDGRSGATRSHAQRALSREHGEDGEHRTFPEVSTVAHSAPVGGPGRRGSTWKRWKHFRRGNATAHPD